MRYKYGDSHIISTEDCDDWPLPSQHTNDQVASSVLPQPPVLHPYLGRILWITIVIVAMFNYLILYNYHVNRNFSFTLYIKHCFVIHN